ncbi:hypothetical protein ES705_25928 [subsurface metagenome]
MKPIRLIQSAWIIEVAILVIVAIILIFGLPGRVPAYVSMLPLLSGLIVAQGGAAFSGPVIKRSQEIKANGK